MSEDRDDEDFNWTDVEHQIVQRPADKVAIYFNPHGDIIVRQGRQWDEEHDTFIVIRRANAEAAIAAMRAALDEGAPAKRLSKSNAERQREYRQRNANRNGERNGVTLSHGGDA